jgi:hypothetical protein
VAIDKAARLAYREVLAYALGIAARVALETGRAEDAGVLGGAFVELFESIGTEPQREEAQRHAATLAAAADLIDVEAAVTRGRALTLEEATGLARDVLSAAV